MQQINAGIYSTRARWLEIVHDCALCKLHNCPWLLQDCEWFVQDGVDPRQLALLVLFPPYQIGLHLHSCYRSFLLHAFPLLSCTDE